jgi:hypothetical protein
MLYPGLSSCFLILVAVDEVYSGCSQDVINNYDQVYDPD